MMTDHPLELYQGTNVDADTQDLIRDWFYYRQVSEKDDDKWLWFFHRQLNEKYPRFKLMLELELQEIPELLDYKEHITRQLQQGGTVQDVINLVSSIQASLSESTERDISGRDTAAESKVTDKDTTDRNSGTDTTTHTGTATTTQTTDGSHVEMIRDLPQSESYSGAAGSLPALDWSTATRQAQTKDNAGASQTVNNLSDATQYGLQKTGTEDTTETINGTYTDTVSDDSTKTQSQTKSDSKTGTTTQNIDKKDAEVLNIERQTVFALDLKDKVWSYLKTHCAIEWFTKALEPVFLGVYDMDEV